jgi:hypothetical protein
MSAAGSTGMTLKRKKFNTMIIKIVINALNTRFVNTRLKDAKSAPS